MLDDEEGRLSRMQGAEMRMIMCGKMLHGGIPNGLLRNRTEWKIYR